MFVNSLSRSFFFLRELIKKIEKHLHRQDLQFDLRQNKANNPFSVTSKKIIKDMGNVELFELCETNPETQCTECILYWSQGIILSIQNYVIKKGRLHGHRYGKTKEQRDHHIAHNLKKRFIKRNFEGIHDRFLKDPEFRESQLEHDRTEEVCIQMDKDAQKDFTYHMTQAENDTERIGGSLSIILETLDH